MGERDHRIEHLGELLAVLSPYSSEHAALIVEAIATCRPMSEIAPLLSCSPKGSLEGRLANLIRAMLKHAAPDSNPTYLDAATQVVFQQVTEHITPIVARLRELSKPLTDS